jgi:hypothetical protein
MEHAHELAFDGAELVAAEALVIPDALEKAFRR